MIVADPILRGVLLPVAVTAAILLLAGRPWRRHESVDRRWSAGVAIGAGFLSAEIALHGLPAWHPQENWHWLVHASFVGLILGLVDCRPTGLRGWIILLRAIACAAVAYVLVPDFPDLENIRPYWIAGLALISLLTWVALNQSSVRVPNTAILLVLLFSYAAGCLLLAYYSSNARFGQLMGVLIASTGTCMMVNFWNRNAIHLAGVAPLIALIFPGLMFNGHFHDWADVPTLSFLLVSVAPLSLAPAFLPPLRKLQHARISVVCTLASLLPLGVALVLAARTHQADPYG